MIGKTSVFLKLRKSRSTSMSREINLRREPEVLCEMVVCDSREARGEDADTGDVDKSRLGLAASCRDHTNDGQYDRRRLCNVSVTNGKWYVDCNPDMDDPKEAGINEASVNVGDSHESSGDVIERTELGDTYSGVNKREECCTFITHNDVVLRKDILNARDQCLCECQSTRSFQLTNDKGEAGAHAHLNADDRFKSVKCRRNSEKERRTLCKTSRREVSEVDINLSHCSGAFMIMNYSSDRSKVSTVHLKPGTKEESVYDDSSEHAVDYHLADRDHGDHPLSHQATAVILDMPFRSVSVTEFQSHLARSNSAAEMFKIFFDDPHLTEDQVREIMFMKSHQGLYASNGETARKGAMMSDLGSNNMDEAFNHYREVEASPVAGCEPKPEVERMDDHQHELGPRTFVPSCTIVHRCRNTTSCCPKGFECVPKKQNGIEIIDRYFIVLEAVPGSDRMKPASKDFIYAKSFQNHTACECVKVEFTSNCAKFCPHSFKKERPGRDCICDCRHGYRKCQRIMRGQLALDEEDLVCIKEGKCIVPECYAGEFNIANGFCRHSDRHKRNQNRH